MMATAQQATATTTMVTVQWVTVQRRQSMALMMATAQLNGDGTTDDDGDGATGDNVNDVDGALQCAETHCICPG